MEIVEIYESTSSDGHQSTGDGLYHLDVEVAKATAAEKHGNYSSPPFQHFGIKVNDGEYLLLVLKNSIVLADSEAAKEKIRQSALSKLSEEERDILGI